MKIDIKKELLLRVISSFTLLFIAYVLYFSDKTKNLWLVLLLDFIGFVILFWGYWQLNREKTFKKGGRAVVKKKEQKKVKKKKAVKIDESIEKEEEVLNEQHKKTDKEIQEDVKEFEKVWEELDEK